MVQRWNFAFFGKFWNLFLGSKNGQEEFKRNSDKMGGKWNYIKGVKIIIILNQIKFNLNFTNQIKIFPKFKRNFKRIKFKKIQIKKKNEKISDETDGKWNFFKGVKISNLINLNLKKIIWILRIKLKFRLNSHKIKIEKNFK